MMKNENHFSSYSVLEEVIHANREKEAFVFCDRSSGELVLHRWTYAQMEDGKLVFLFVVDVCSIRIH
jgi:hypothetical protein